MPRRTDLLDLVRIASEQTHLSGISEMLRCITQALSGWGTLIWALSASSGTPNGDPRLFVLAYWITNEKVRVWHEIDMQSMTGWVLQHGQPDQSMLGDRRNFTPTPKLIEDSGTQRFALAPLQMADGTKAVLEVYRTEDRAFSEEEMALLEEMAAVLPVLYKNLTDRVGVKMLDDVNAICLADDSKSNIDIHDNAFNEIVSTVDEAFASLEVSLFLQTLNNEPEQFPLVAQRKVWTGPLSGRTEYRSGQGATGYVLKTGRTVMLNLSHYREDSAWLQATYPGLNWEDSLKIRDRALDYFDVSDPESSPPLGFVCAPITAGDKILGAIRCSGSKTSPFYFDAWQARYFEALGQRLGYWWSNILKRQQLSRENRAWQSLMEGFDQMNRFVQKHLKKQSWDDFAFFREAMRLAHGVIPHTDNSDIVLIEGNELATVATYGPDWEHHPRQKTARYRINPPESSASFLIRESGKSVEIFDTPEQAPHRNFVLPGTRKLVLAKIEAGGEVYGVLRIRSKSSRPFSPAVRLIAGLLGQQLGLYHSLLQQIRNLQTAERTNRLLIDVQAKALGDVHHQVKSPIINAHRAAQKVMGDPKLPAELRPEVERVRSLCGKVSRVVSNMGMFADLAAEKPIRLAKTVLNRDVLVRALREACEDHQLLVDSERHLRFALDEKSFEELAGRDRLGKLVEADWALIEQCINNLLDNATKYSYDATVVSVSGGIQAKGTEFFISVENEGFEIRPEEVQKLKVRGYRSDQAIAVTGEGSGIGLWIVDEIMRAHGGRLAITPTEKEVTDFRLVFPIIKGVDKLTYEPLSARARG